MQQYIVPYADIVAWCLMPNHFHIMLYVNELEVSCVSSDSLTLSETITEGITKNKPKTRNFNDSIGLLLRSYTRAINEQEKRTGSLFKTHTKAECITKTEGVSPSFLNTAFGTQINVRIQENEYPFVCWNYIHNNPVEAKMVNKPEDYVFSSYRDFAGLRDGKLINKARAKEFGLIL